jgi:crossover junction endodeoxyribonuclease RuvC
MSSMRVLGIDCGSQYTGFGIVQTDGQRHALVTSGAVCLNRKSAFTQKLQKIHEEIESLIRIHVPAVVAVEDQFYVSNFKSVLKLGQVKGVILLAAAEAGLPIFEYTPLEIKNAVTGYGRAAKFQVQAMVKELLRLPIAPQPFDASDALALAICHIHTSATQTKLQIAAAGTGRQVCS